MILLHVTQTLKNRDERDRYYAKLCASGIPDASRGEDGNLGYDYFFPADTDNRILLIEKWESDEALTRHQHTDHFLAIPAIKSEFSIDTKVERFDI